MLKAYSTIGKGYIQSIKFTNRMAQINMLNANAIDKWGRQIDSNFHGRKTMAFQMQTFKVI